MTQVFLPREKFYGYMYAILQEKLRSKGMFGIEDNVLVHGSQPKKPIYRFSDARFAEIVSQVKIHVL